MAVSTKIVKLHSPLLHHRTCLEQAWVLRKTRVCFNSDVEGLSDFLDTRNFSRAYFRNEEQDFLKVPLGQSAHAIRIFNRLSGIVNATRSVH